MSVSSTGGSVKLCADCIAHDCGSRDELRGRRVIHTSPRHCECVCDHRFEGAECAICVPGQCSGPDCPGWLGPVPRRP